jgi:hypothetical protein
MWIIKKGRGRILPPSSPLKTPAEINEQGILYMIAGILAVIAHQYLRPTKGIHKGGFYRNKVIGVIIQS